MKKQAALVTTIIGGLAFGTFGCSSSDSTAGGSGGSGGGLTDAGGGDASGPACPATADVIASFTTSTGVETRPGRTGGFYIYFEGDQTILHENQARLDPPKTAAAPPRDATMGNHCSPMGSLRQKATGVTGWGVGIGTNIAAAAAGNKKGTYDAVAAGYTGIRLWTKCTNMTDHVSVKIPTIDTDFDSTAPKCTSYGDCNAHGKYNQTVGTTWQVFEVPFADAVQDSATAATTTPVPVFDATKITAIQIQINSKYVDGGAVPNDFECWFDDVSFYK